MTNEELNTGGEPQTPPEQNQNGFTAYEPNPSDGYQQQDGYRQQGDYRQQDSYQQYNYQQGGYQQGNYQQNAYQQNSYQQGGGYGQPYYEGKPPKGDGKGFGIASLVLGIVSIFLFGCCVNYITAVLSIIFAIIQLVKNKSKGFAIAGIVTSCVSIVLGILMWIGVFGLMRTPEFYENYERFYEDLYDDFYDETDDYMFHDHHELPVGPGL